jgi:hypothetical protein
MANWLEFITNAWTQEGDAVSYYLVDVRDVDPRVWAPCTPDGTHACPYPVDQLPFTAAGDTRTATSHAFDVYNCSPADESGAEIVYLLTVDRPGTVTATLVEGTAATDVDVHLLDADDPNACLARGNLTLTQAIAPGRYYVVVDTYVASGVPKAGPYELTITFY